ncbi:LysE family translocator [Nocardioides mangrovicus]|uniref:LysE family translocator n=1 Tax=Nocardioides mangrovicus TaxID=2478913 RepID=A0A3L8P0U0_9ACTN|nr:LysE family translocator [Nocardioides mangrovicus]RLV49060.1 LysE family translocator [Nocardioides mangrovicus]
MGVAFFLTSFVIVATPGTGAVLTIAAGLRGGRRLSVITAFGCTLGIVPHLAAAMTGTAAMLRAGGLAFDVLKAAGLLYLLYMAWSTWHDNGALDLEATDPAPAWRTIGNAVLANLLNPKLTLFFFAFLPQFVDRAHGSPTTQMLAMSAAFMAMTFVVFTAYGLFASAMRTHVIGQPGLLRRIRRTFALGYLALGAKLATTHH